VQIDQLQTFLAVLDHGGFSRAAEVLRIGQSTVSFHVKALETALGARLLDRRGGAVRATAAGRVLTGYARRILALRDEAATRVRAEESGARGHVVIAASTIPGEYLLPEVLARFRAAHPEVAVTVGVSDTRRAGAQLLAHECDLAVVGARLTDRRLTCTAVADDEIVLVAPTTGKYAVKGPLAPATLATLPVVAREPGSATGDAARALLTRVRGDASAGAPAAIVAGSTEAAKRCVLRGLGLTFLSRRAIDDDVAAGRLQIVQLPGTPIVRQFFLLQLKGVTLTAAARALRASLVQHRR
jgi:DNA-binding transcriptional LysR family regulator